MDPTNMGVSALGNRTKFSFGCILRNAHGSEGVVHEVYFSFDDVLNSLSSPVGPSWFDIQEKPISTKDQPFYSCIVIGRDKGSFLVPEDQATEVER